MLPRYGESCAVFVQEIYLFDFLLESATLVELIAPHLIDLTMWVCEVRRPCNWIVCFDREWPKLTNADVGWTILNRQEREKVEAAVRRRAPKLKSLTILLTLGLPNFRDLLPEASLCVLVICFTLVFLFLFPSHFPFRVI